MVYLSTIPASYPSLLKVTHLYLLLGVSIALLASATSAFLYVFPRLRQDKTHIPMVAKTNRDDVLVSRETDPLLSHS